MDVEEEHVIYEKIKKDKEDRERDHVQKNVKRNTDVLELGPLDGGKH